MDGNGHTKVNHSDELIAAIRRASGKMSFEEYAKAAGVDKEFIFRILKGDIEQVDEDTLKKLSLLH